MFAVCKMFRLNGFSIKRIAIFSICYAIFSDAQPLAENSKVIEAFLLYSGEWRCCRCRLACCIKRKIYCFKSQGVTPVEFCGDLWHQKTRVPGLLCGVACVILRLAVLAELRLVTDGHRPMASTAGA